VQRILIVEDTPEIAEALQHHLERRGYATSLASKAAHALALATSERPDLVVLDLGLPDRDGYSVLEQLRDRGDDTPVLILSARQEESDKVKGFRLGADDYVTKPFGALELLERIAALLRRQQRSGGDAAPVEADPSRDDELSDLELESRFGLTPRQVTVARLLAEGLSNSEIAGHLVVSEHTARNHTYQVLTKMGTSKRARVGTILRGRPRPE
jgi:DNA-binding response OmpR family regulator